VVSEEREILEKLARAAGWRAYDATGKYERGLTAYEIVKARGLWLEDLRQSKINTP
jgi:hypothetical protein